MDAWGLGAAPVHFPYRNMGTVRYVGVGGCRGCYRFLDQIEIEDLKTVAFMDTKQVHP